MKTGTDKLMWALAIAAAGSVASAPTAISANDNLGVVLQSAYTSNYHFRGITRSGDALQTSAEVSYANLTVGAWTSVGLGDDEGVFTDEIDIYAFTGWNLGDAVSAEVGATLYHFPQLGGFFDIGNETGDASTIEVYGGIDFNVPFEPRVTGYYDVNLRTVTLEGGLSYPVAIGSRVSIVPSFDAGLVEDSDGDGVDYQYAEASGRLEFGISGSAALFTSGHYAISTEDTFLDTDFSLSDADKVLNPQQNAAWFKVGLSATY
ncbi:TorF family putative porin [uncultured Algimonas sp.]|uniref:TorF family putative porin n=1 Tax=uncultured Algimonas sp. TaxID=1547920 RepID=UPI00261B6D48|nr:TorF family putative porin [uncultured Algimonas sp.]